MVQHLEEGTALEMKNTALGGQGTGRRAKSEQAGSLIAP